MAIGVLLGQTTRSPLVLLVYNRYGRYSHTPTLIQQQSPSSSIVDIAAYYSLELNCTTNTTMYCTTILITPLTGHLAFVKVQRTPPKEQSRLIMCIIIGIYLYTLRCKKNATRKYIGNFEVLQFFNFWSKCNDFFCKMQIKGLISTGISRILFKTAILVIIQGELKCCSTPLNLKHPVE